MNFYKRLNNLVGWAVFLVALITYTLTLEANASFWDCGEFISGAYKMQVVHPPGAPTFLLLGRIFTLFAFDDPNMIAWTVNFLSGLTSAFAVLFLFWITTGFARKIVFPGKEPSQKDAIVTVITGAIAALACTFTDTIWFSAVEGEVYAMSLFFMMLVFWCMMKWESSEDPVHRDRWIILTAFLLGVSSGVHLLSFLAIPAMAVIYYFKRWKENTTPLGTLVAIGVGFILLGFFFKFIVSKMIGIIAGFELFFTNTLGMGFGTGFGVFAVLLTAVLVGAIVYTHIKNKHDWHVGAVSLLMVFIGFSTYMIVIIRANADTPINMNTPDNVFALESYLNREQYGDRPLLYGPHYDAYPIDRTITGKKYVPSEDGTKYEYIGDKIGYEFDKKTEMFFPRLGSWQNPDHKDAYRSIIQPDFMVVAKGGGDVNKIFKNTNGWQATKSAAEQYLNSMSGKESYEVKDAITGKDNLYFFFRYQVGVMYWRYFMWNFSGRQNDKQGRFDNADGRWVTGFEFIDKMRRGPMEYAPEHEKDNMANNVYYMIPFFLGLVGLIFHFIEDPRNAFIVLVLFAFAGVLQVVYLNSPPFEPRERDYTLVGSFVTYCLWIGFAFLAIYKSLEKSVGAVPGMAVAAIICLSAPVLLATENWDDHDRSEHTTARDYAINYLESCAPNAIVFTQGDNDTYPLWYAQEVEGIRTDVRVVNLSLLGVDWYVKQLNYKANDAPAVKLTHTVDKYLGNRRDYVQYVSGMADKEGEFYDLGQVVNFIASDDARTKVRTRDGESVDFLPARGLKISIDSAKVVESGMVAADKYGEIVDEIRWTLPGSSVLKNDLITLDIIANNFWDRPIYFAVSVSPAAHLGLSDYMQLDGLAYRLVPVKTTGQYTGYIASDIMYENIMNKFRWGGVEKRIDINYTVKEGETLADVAYNHNLTVSQVKEQNPGLGDNVSAGQQLKLNVTKKRFMDENTLRMTMNLRSNFGRLADELVNEDKLEEAEKVLDYCLQVLPLENVPYNVFMIRFPEIYYKMGEKEKAQLVSKKMADVFQMQFLHAKEMEGIDPGAGSMQQQSLAVFQELLRIAKQYNDSELEQYISNRFATMKTFL